MKAWFESISSATLHGFGEGALGVEKLSDGLNVIYAPNASGKSTLAKALQSAMDPAVLPKMSRVQGVCWLRDHRYEFDVSSGGPAGVFTDKVDRSDRYLLALVDLLNGLQGKDQSLLTQLFDDGIQLKTKAPSIGTGRNLEKAATNRRMQIREANILRELEARKPQLDAACNRAKHARAAAQVLETEAKRRSALEQLESIEAELERLSQEHAGIDRLEGQATAQLDAFRTRLEGRLKALQAAVDEAGRYSKPIQGPSGLTTADDFSQIGALAEQIRLLKEQNREHQINVARSQAAAESYSQRLAKVGVDLNHDHSLADLLNDVSRLVSSLDQARMNRQTREAWKSVVAALNEDRLMSHVSAEELDRAIQILARSLESSELVTVSSNVQPSLLQFALAVALSVVMLLPVDSSIRLASGIAGLVIAAMLFFVRQQPGTTTTRAVEQDLGALPFRPQSDAIWHRVEALQRTLNTRERLSLAERAAERERAVPDDPVVAVDWERRSGRGLNEGLAYVEVWEFLKGLEDALNQKAIHEAEGKRCEAEMSGLRRQIAEIYGRIGFSHPEGVETELWAKRCEEWNRAHESLAREQREFDALVAEIGQWVQGAGLGSVQIQQTADLTELIQLARSREPVAATYRDLVAKRDVIRMNLVDLPERMSDVLQAVELANEIGGAAVVEPQTGPAVGELEIYRDRLEEEAGRFEELAKELADVKAQIENSRIAESVRRAEADFQQALAEAERDCLRRQSEAVDYVLSSALRERLVQEDAPAALKQATSFCERFTEGRYSLEMGAQNSEGLGPLIVRDRLRGTTTDFASLSTGTKLHVVLAIRLGLIQEAENASPSPIRYPLIVDEPLGVSDDKASRAIVQVLAEASQTRQVVIFSNQPDDVFLLRELCPEVHAGTLKGGRQTEVEHRRTGDHPVYVAPEGPIELDERLPVRAHSPFFLFTEEELGSLSSCSNLAEIAQMATSPEHEQILNVLAAAEALQRAMWAHKPPLRVDDLRNSGWKGTFADEIHALVDAARGDAQAALEAIAALPRFRKEKLEEARADLQDGGFLNEPLAVEQAMSIVRGAYPEMPDLLVRRVVGAFMSRLRYGLIDDLMPPNI